MDRDIFQGWLYQQFIPAVKQHHQAKGLPGKAMLLIDNSAPHPDQNLLCSHEGQIKTVFLIPTTCTTAVILPLNGGILNTAKRNYRKCLLQSVLTENEGEGSPSLLEMIKGMSVKDIAYTLYMAEEA